jgi:hypothetical protein
MMASGYDYYTDLPMGPGARASSALFSTPSNALLHMTGVNTEWSMSGDADAYYKDVWASTNQGRTFEPINLNSPFGRRDDARVDITSTGIIAMAGGYVGGGVWSSFVWNDVWASVNGGYTWSVVASIAWPLHRRRLL